MPRLILHPRPPASSGKARGGRRQHTALAADCASRRGGPAVATAAGFHGARSLAVVQPARRAAMASTAAAPPPPPGTPIHATWGPGNSAVVHAFPLYIPNLHIYPEHTRVRTCTRTCVVQVETGDAGFTADGNASASGL